MLEKSSGNLFILAILIYVFLGICVAFSLACSAFLYRKIKKAEPEFFSQKNLFYYMTSINSTQFAFYILFNYCKKIKDDNIRAKCYLVRNFLYVILLCMVISALIIMTYICQISIK